MPNSELKTEFIRLISENKGILHKISNIYCNQVEDKKDLIQEMTLQLWKSFPSFHGQSKISSWIYRVAINTAVTNIRKSKKHPLMEALFESEVKIPAREYDPDLDDDLNRLYHAISKLNDIEKAVILLYLEEKPYQEIAGIVGISEKHVSVKLVRIKKKLKSYLSDVTQ